MKSALVQILFSLLGVLILSGCCPVSEPAALPEYIMHAGGVTPDGRIGTNSVEAMNASYEDGHYWLEMDFNLTSDGHYVCLHDWQSTYSINLTGVDTPDLATFEAYRKVTYGYESPTLESLLQWLDAHPKAVIITDVKSGSLAFARYVSENFPDYADRFVIQIYSSAEYEHVSGYGFDKIIYTLYNEPMDKKYDVEALRSFARNQEHLIAFAYADDKDNADRIAEIAGIGIPVYIHTINNADDRLFWKAYGAYGFYCDFTEQRP